MTAPQLLVKMAALVRYCITISVAHLNVKSWKPKNQGCLLKVWLGRDVELQTTENLGVLQAYVVVIQNLASCNLSLQISYTFILRIIVLASIVHTFL